LLARPAPPIPAEKQQQIDDLSEKIGKLDHELDKERTTQTASASDSDGLLARMAALEDLVRVNSALRVRRFLIALLLILIDSMPVLGKFVMGIGGKRPYDALLQAKEEVHVQQAKRDTAAEKAKTALHEQQDRENRMRERARARVLRRARRST